MPYHEAKCGYQKSLLPKLVSFLDICHHCEGRILGPIISTFIGSLV